jgi:hypothetical protein
MYVQLLVWKYAFQKQAGVGKILFFSNTEKTKMMCGKMRKKIFENNKPNVSFEEKRTILAVCRNRPFPLLRDPFCRLTLCIFFDAAIAYLLD